MPNPSDKLSEGEAQDLGVAASSGGRSGGPSDPRPQAVSAVPAPAANAWPRGPYVFDDISTRSQDDGLGYVYFAESESGFGPTLAHTGARELSAEQNRALGHLFAAAPDLAEALRDALWAIDNMAAFLTSAGLQSTLTDPTPKIRAALSRLTPSKE